MIHNDSSVQYPRAITHVGLTVTDLDRAVVFYQNVFGATILLGPTEFVSEEPAAADFLGPDFKRTRVVYLGFGNGVALEVFEFVQPRAEPRAQNFEYWKTGVFHLAIVDPDIEGLVQRIVEYGGKQRSHVWEIFPGYKAVYTEDPFGTIIEIYSHSTEQVVSNREV